MVRVGSGAGYKKGVGSENEKVRSVMLMGLLLLLMVVGGVTAGQADAACHPDDKRVLLQIKQHFNNVYPFSTWNSSTDCCEWTQVVGCGRGESSGRITTFIAASSHYYQIRGEIPAALGDLPFLEVIGFQELPHLTGSIPESLTKLTHLSQLYISVTNLSGPIPDFLSQIKSLVTLGLEASRFSGTIPSSLSLLPKLSSLILSRNYLLSGSIPDSFGSFKNNMTLMLDQNQLSGPIPSSLGNVNFEVVDLSFNNLTGDASFLFGNNKPLRQMLLRSNELSFNLSNVQLPFGITHFDISNNKVYGSIPTQFALLRQLQQFNVSHNQLCGKVPKGRRFKQFGPDAFAHNKCLCDAPGLPPCH